MKIVLAIKCANKTARQIRSLDNSVKSKRTMRNEEKKIKRRNFEGSKIIGVFSVTIINVKITKKQNRGGEKMKVLSKNLCANCAVVINVSVPGSYDSERGEGSQRNWQ